MTDSANPPERRIYLDAAASTAVRPEALEVMLPLFSQHFGNPSAHHAGGRASAEALAGARETVAEVLGARAEEVVFTSGGTESINAAIKGVAFAQRDAGAGAHVVTSAVEHHAVLHSMHYLERFGFEVEIVPVDEHGVVDPAAIAAAVRDDTVPGLRDVREQRGRHRPAAARDRRGGPGAPARHRTADPVPH